MEDWVALVHGSAAEIRTCDLVIDKSETTTWSLDHLGTQMSMASRCGTYGAPKEALITSLLKRGTVFPSK